MIDCFSSQQNDSDDFTGGGGRRIAVNKLWKEEGKPPSKLPRPRHCVLCRHVVTNFESPQKRGNNKRGVLDHDLLSLR